MQVGNVELTYRFKNEHLHTFFRLFPLSRPSRLDAPFLLFSLSRRLLFFFPYPQSSLRLKLRRIFLDRPNNSFWYLSHDRIHLRAHTEELRGETFHFRLQLVDVGLGGPVLGFEMHGRMIFGGVGYRRAGSRGGETDR